MNLLKVYFAYTALQIIYHFIGKGDKKSGTRGGCQLLKGSFTLKCRRNVQWLFIHLSQKV